MEAAVKDPLELASVTRYGGASIVLYDGVCGLCNGAIRFVWRRDPAGRFRFASLQSRFAREVLSRHQRDPRDLDTMYVIVDYDEPAERLLEKAAAVLYVLRELGGIWRLGALARWVHESEAHRGSRGRRRATPMSKRRHGAQRGSLRERARECVEQERAC